MKRAPSIKTDSKRGASVGADRAAGKVDRVSIALAATPRAVDLRLNLKSCEAPIMTMPTAASRRSTRDVGLELKTRILNLHEDTPLRDVGLIWTPCRDCDSLAGALRLDMSKALKHSPQLKRHWSHSINRVVVATAPVSSDMSSFGLTAYVMTLVFSTDAVSARRFTHRTSDPISPNAHLRPVPEPHWLDAPTPESIGAFIDAFMHAPTVLRRDFEASWRVHNKRQWRATREQRAVALFQIDAQIPITKTFFGAGHGEVILRQALAKPIVEARMAKKAENSLDRADVVHLFCLHALETDGAPPPLVKL
ncbi:hypothetical protein [Sphingomonas sp. BK235]|uniref:hypothetical protein n=1 Tax=Sphingomonas sp. BK235 TaxID=2512131 RepID=UPI00104C4A61|nr:hypothetical protein [Sphingomonas sp. BK235]TCP31354.1 hypothetical protein EV292_1109 [Sphingomonas sp. BK235]